MEEIELTAVQKKMEEFIRREQLLEMGDRVVLGVSGGADSVCMMELFAAIREAWQLELLVVHVHHGLRGVEADRDASFVQAEAEKLGIDCVVERREVRRLSLEEAGRDVRYEILREYAKNWTSQKDGLRDGCGSETLESAGCRPAGVLADASAPFAALIYKMVLQRSLRAARSAAPKPAAAGHSAGKPGKSAHHPADSAVHPAYKRSRPSFPDCGGPAPRWWAL